MKIKWQCTLCDDIVESDSKVTHQMDVCKCGKTGFDLEEGYSRGMGLNWKKLSVDGVDVK